MFGKYSNNYKGTKVPKGWDYWMGLEGNSIYYNYTLNHNGKQVNPATVIQTHSQVPDIMKICLLNHDLFCHQEIHNDSYAHDYLPDLLTNTTIDFIGQNDTKYVISPTSPILSNPFRSIRSLIN